jgi:hypothetical protein
VHHMVQRRAIPDAFFWSWHQKLNIDQGEALPGGTPTAKRSRRRRLTLLRHSMNSTDSKYSRSLEDGREGARSFTVESPKICQPSRHLFAILLIEFNNILRKKYCICKAFRKMLRTLSNHVET